jgi:hypothetical protein
MTSNDNLLDPIDGNAALDTTTTDPEEDSHVEAGQDEANTPKEQEESENEDCCSDVPDSEPAGDTLPPFEPDAALLAKFGELIATRKELESVRAQKKASAAAYSEREKGLDARVGDLTQEIEEKTWHERFDEEDGVVYRTNRLTGETETRPYSPPAQPEIPFVDERLRGITSGMFGEDPDGNAYKVEAVARDSVVISYYDDGTKRIGVDDWPEFAPRDDVEQRDYEEAFSEEQAVWTQNVLEAIHEEGSTIEQVTEALMLSAEHEGRVARALDRLDKNKAVRTVTREVDGEEQMVILLQDPDEVADEPEKEVSILDHVTEQWEAVGTIAERAGLDSKVAAWQIKKELEAGRVEAEGEKRGRKYRRVAS